MANPVQSQEVDPDTLRKHLAVAVRSIQWSYAIFWSLSKTQQGVLQWGNGYYNGDIKTRKTVQAMELKADKIGLQRSVQLRELYEFLLEGEIDQNKRPSAALSPEDLSDAEWYYLVCMSFVFNPGQGLPGRALANNETIWLCNAHYADSKVFSRSLLAKSASIQTVVCFPYLGGVIELGVTELVPEDPNLPQHIKASLLDMSKPVCSGKSSPPHNADDDIDPICVKVDQEVVETLDLENLYSHREEMKIGPEEGIEELHANIPEDFTIGSPDECSNGCEHHCHTEDSLMFEGLNGVGSQVQSWHFMDDDCSNGAHNTINSSDCISGEEKAPISSPKQGSVNHFHVELGSLDLGVDDDLHYKKTLSVILKCSNRLTEIPGLHTIGHKSGFVSWKKGGMGNGYRPRWPQSILKKILVAVPIMHGGRSLGFQKDSGKKHYLEKLENDDNIPKEHENFRENEKFLVLKAMVPSISEIDKASILNDTIKYLKELEARVEELESCMDSADFETRPRRNYLDIVEETSDNYENRKTENAKKCWINKRKASDFDENYETDTEVNRAVLRDSLISDLKVSIKEQEVLIEMKCPYREYILLDIMEAINNLHLDAHTVQSSALDGILMLTLKSKFRGTAIAPARMIKQALQKVAGKC
ncbi:hypothetical protein SLEP1_g10043 [Rubroshorea leprosula]|uniref:BHLH domain-containing protein n=1 Tax=Rubroshorea leprosula TaxID=152421 RepID=A0AAV5ICJ8_9ROSI|nr:hypothetical protein SLEP1_g10043 [Rubroshorea leprosula]